MGAADDFRFLAEKGAHVLKRCGLGIQRGPSQRRAVGSARRCRLRETKIHHAVSGEVGIEHHIEQSALSTHRHRRHSCKRIAQLAVKPYHPQASRALGYEESTIRQECKAPRVLQAAGDGLCLDALRLQWR